MKLISIVGIAPKIMALILTSAKAVSTQAGQLRSERHKSNVRFRAL